MRELQAEGLVHRVAGAGTFLKKGAGKAAGKFGLVVPALGRTEIFDPICAEITSRASAAGYQVLSGGAWPSSTDERRTFANDLCKRYIDQDVKGVFLAPSELIPQNHGLSQEIVRTFKAADIAVILLDSDIEPFPARSDLDLVSIDNVAAGFVLTRHLIDLGCRHIRFTAYPHSASTVDMRITGWREAMSRSGLACSQDMVFWGDHADPDFAQRVVKHEHTDAIVAANDLGAAHLMKSLASLGIHIPNDVRLVGFDDVQYAGLLAIPLTTMHQPCQAIAAAAVEAMLQRIRTPEMARREILLDATLVVRQSCGAHL